MQNITRMLIARYRLIFIVLTVVVTVLACIALLSLRIETSLEEFIPHKHPYTAIHHQLEHIFGGLNQVSILIQSKNDTIFQPELLKRVYEATESLYLIEGVNISRIDGIAARKTRRVEPGPNGFNIRRLIHQPLLSEDEIRELKNYVKGNPMLHGVLVSKDLSATLIQADFFPEISSQAIFKKIKDLANQTTSPDLDIFYSGKPVLEGWLDWYLPNMGILFIASAVILCGLLYASFRSIRAVLLPLCAAGMAGLWGLAAIALLGYHLTPSTVLVPFLVFALGICHSVQFMKCYFDQISFSESPVLVSQNVFSLLAGPVSVSLITDGIGFFSLLLIPLGLIQKMALAAGIGIMSLFLTVLLFIPALLSYLPIPHTPLQKTAKHQSLVDRLLPYVAGMILSHRRFIIGLFAVLLLCGMWGITKLEIGDNQPGSSALYPDSHYNQSERRINELFNGTDPFYILVKGTIDEALISSAVLRDMESLQEHLLATLPEAGRARSLVEYIKGFNMVFNGFDRESFRIPDLDATIGEYLFLYSIAGYPGDFDFLCDRDFKHANIKIDLRDHKPSTLSHILTATADWIATSQQSKRVSFLFPGGFAGIQAAVHETIQYSIPSTICFVTLVLFMCASLFMGSISRGMLLIIPLLFSVIVTFGIMGYLSIPLTIETLPLASLGMGLGIDYGIYIAAHMSRQEITKRAIAGSLATSGRAVFFGAASVSLAVLLWVCSPVKMDAKLGTCLSLLLFINMLSALFFLPALLAGRNSTKSDDTP
jgi:hypothetical protein